MNRNNQNSDRGLPCRAKSRSGLTLVEVIAASMILGGVAVATLVGVSDLLRSQRQTAEIAQAELLARDLIAEIVQQKFDVTGPSEMNPTTRENFDDVNDYGGWNHSQTTSPQNKDGTPIPLGAGWARRVEIDVVRKTDTRIVTTIDEGVKRVTVTVSRDGVDLAQFQRTITRFGQLIPAFN